MSCLLHFDGERNAQKKAYSQQSLDNHVISKCSFPQIYSLRLSSTNTIYWFLSALAHFFRVLVANKFSFSVKISIDVWNLSLFTSPFPGGAFFSREILFAFFARKLLCRAFLMLHEFRSCFLFLCFHIHFILLLSTIFSLSSTPPLLGVASALI